MDNLTLKDIAQALNLSTSTVSRALRDSYEISPETKRLVVEYAEKFNYQPNAAALSLKGGNGRAIGVIVPQVANYFYSQVIDGIEAMAQEQGYHVLIFQTQETHAREVSSVQQALSRKVDGLLISLSGETNDYAHLQEVLDRGVPLVQFNRVAEQLPTTKIVADNFGGAFAATTQLLQTGRRRIAHLTIPPWLSVTQERLAGYRAALAQYGVPYDEALVRYGSFTTDEVVAFVDELLALRPAPDAFFTAGEWPALSCLRTLHQRGIRIPEDVSLVGFTNLNVPDMLAPALSTVCQPATQMGQTAAEHLIELIEHGSRAAPPTTITIPTELSPRRSSLP